MKRAVRPYRHLGAIPRALCYEARSEGERTLRLTQSPHLTSLS